MTIVETQAVSKQYRLGSRDKVQALVDASLAIEAGGMTVLIGASGAGKTSLLSILGVLEHPTSGRVLFRGRDLGSCSGYELARTRRTIGHIFQTFALIPQLTVLENVTYPLIPRGISRRERNRTAMEWLGRLGLENQSTRRAGALSGGEQQRVAAARAFAGSPELLLADEPTSNLDEELRTTLIELLIRLRDRGTTIVVSTHDTRLIAVADRVCELAAGRILSDRIVCPPQGDQ